MRNVLSQKMKLNIIASNHGIPSSRLTTAIREYERFIYILGLFKTEVYLPISDEIDEIWHLCILDTEEYKKTCHKICGRFIHHVPDNHINKAQLSESKKMKDSIAWIRNYVKIFGCFTEESLDFWPTVSQTIENLNCSLEIFNKYIINSLNGELDAL